MFNTVWPQGYCIEPACLIHTVIWLNVGKHDVESSDRIQACPRLLFPKYNVTSFDRWISRGTFDMLFVDKSKKNKVAVLPEGSEIEVLLSDDPKWYLVRSSFGLVGWVEVPEYAMNTNIGLSFAGD